jgi:hypothetical protein
MLLMRPLPSMVALQWWDPISLLAKVISVFLVICNVFRMRIFSQMIKLSNRVPESIRGKVPDQTSLLFPWWCVRSDVEQ